MNKESQAKLIVVFYVGVKNIDSIDVPAYLNECSQSLQDPEVKTYVVPDCDTNSCRVECINPVLLTPERYKEAEDKLDMLEKRIADMFNKTI